MGAALVCGYVIFADSMTDWNSTVMLQVRPASAIRMIKLFATERVLVTGLMMRYYVSIYDTLEYVCTGTLLVPGYRNVM